MGREGLIHHWEVWREKEYKIVNVGVNYKTNSKCLRFTIDLESSFSMLTTMSMLNYSSLIGEGSARRRSHVN